MTGLSGPTSSGLRDGRRARQLLALADRPTFRLLGLGIGLVAAVAVLAGITWWVGNGYIPGLKGSPGAVPASPSAYDLEFDSALGGTVLGSLDIDNITDFPSHWHMRKNTSGDQLDGRYWTCPSPPFVMTAHIPDQLWLANYQSVGILIAESSPGKLFSFGYRVHSSFSSCDISCQSWTNRTTESTPHEAAAGNTNANLSVHPFLRMVVTSATSVVCQHSPRGHFWEDSPYGTINPGFTPGNFGLYTRGYSGAACEMVVDWVRFVTGTAGQTWNGSAWV